MPRYTLLVLLTLTVSLSAPEDANSAACVVAHAEARYRYPGYDHVVVLANACAHPQACAVATNVNPQATQVAVPGQSRVEVVTFRGSPARVFIPQVSCAPAGR